MNLDDSVEVLRGVGPKIAEILKKYGIHTVKDFLYNLPKDYENYARPVSISEIRPGKIVVKGKIDKISTRRARKRNLAITEGVIKDNSGSLKVVWFNQGYRTRQFSPEKEYYFAGDYELRNGRYSLISPSATLASDVDLSSNLIPIYKAHGALKSRDFKRIAENSRDKFVMIPDLLPTVRPGTRRSALFSIHFPDSLKSIQKSRDYLAYEELFELILASRLNQRENEKLKSAKIPFKLEKTKEFLANLPFELTGAQKRAAWEIFQDMDKTTPMNRLLQGDVGSGKTVVAAMAAYQAILAGKQVALLAPTEILAAQHFENLKQILEPFRITIALLTGSTKDKKSLKEGAQNGKINLVVGTHALLTNDTRFSELSLAIIDEQHRFGVEQRQKLVLKSPAGLAPHLLTMTATPIPRSLQLTVFGDLDVSTLKELPKGRQPIKTEILSEIEIQDQLYPKILKTVESGSQAYWICRAIDDDPRTETTSVKTRCDRLRRLFPKLRIEFLHGRMKSAEKDKVMKRFAENKIDILVSTTVVEVGVDVPNATLIIIENAEGYGLAQIHQLRGRVGRGTTASYCYLLTANDAQPSRRLKELERSTDGFYLAEADLKIRGPGEIYGSLQHGALDLRIATFSDMDLISRAQRDVATFLQKPENMVKYKELMAGITKYQQITTLN